MCIRDSSLSLSLPSSLADASGAWAQADEGRSTALGAAIKKQFGESTLEENQDDTLLTVISNLPSDTGVSPPPSFSSSFFLLLPATARCCKVRKASRRSRRRTRRAQAHRDAQRVLTRVRGVRGTESARRGGLRWGRTEGSSRRAPGRSPWLPAWIVQSRPREPALRLQCQCQRAPGQWRAT
eukprot:2326716-Rhodomonas_salina.1